MKLTKKEKEHCIEALAFFRDGTTHDTPDSYKDSCGLLPSSIKYKAITKLKIILESD